MDQDEIRGTIEHLGDGGVPGVVEASLDCDSEAFAGGWEGAGLTGATNSSASVGAGPNSRSTASSPDGVQPGADVEVPMGAVTLETLTGFGRDADMKWNTVHHKTHRNT